MIANSYISRLREEDIKFMFLPYARLIKTVYESYFNQRVDAIKITQMSLLKDIEYKFRGLVRHIPFVQWLYFHLFNHKYKGHGTSV